MGAMMEPELLTECADWIATQLAEDGVLIDPALVQLILEREQAIAADAPRPQVTAALAAALVEEGLIDRPGALDGRLIGEILGWEDEFLALAGRPRG